jgi:hypothetical protein
MKKDKGFILETLEGTSSWVLVPIAIVVGVFVAVINAALKIGRQ